MDEVTQQNSALVEENAATAKTLEHQANAMNDRVAAFHIVGGDFPALAHEQRPVEIVRAKPQSPAVSKRTAAARPQPTVVPKRVAAGGGRASAAINREPDWKEF